MSYNIPHHRADRETSASKPSSKAHRGIDLTRNVYTLNHVSGPVVLNGEDKCYPKTSKGFGTRTHSVPVSEIKLMLPFGPIILRYNPAVPSSEQRDIIPEVFLDAMTVRKEVLVNERGGKLEDIAPDLWDDSISLHWVGYHTDYVDGESAMAAPNGAPGRSCLRRHAWGTIKVRPVFVTKRPEDRQCVPPHTGVRLGVSYLLLSEPMILARYRGRQWAENMLVDAVLKALECQSQVFFADLLELVMPLPQGLIQLYHQSPPGLIMIRRLWRRHFEEIIPASMRWSGLLYVHADRNRRLWWKDRAGFAEDRAVGVWDNGDDKGGQKIGMYRVSHPVKTMLTDSACIRVLSFDQRKALCITAAMASGMQRVVWTVKVLPEIPVRPPHEDRGARGR